MYTNYMHMSFMMYTDYIENGQKRKTRKVNLGWKNLFRCREDCQIHGYNILCVIFHYQSLISWIESFMFYFAL